MIKFNAGMRLVSSTKLEYVITLTGDDFVRYQQEGSGVNVQHSAKILAAEINSGRMAIVPDFSPDLGIDKQAILSRRVESLHGPLNDAEQVSASVPVAAVVTGDGIAYLRNRIILRAYRTKAEHGLNPTRTANLTIRSFNAAYGARCRNWGQVAQVAHYLLIKEG